MLNNVTLTLKVITFFKIRTTGNVLIILGHTTYEGLSVINMQQELSYINLTVHQKTFIVINFHQQTRLFIAVIIYKITLNF